jgi:hypothetical protein
VYRLQSESASHSADLQKSLDFADNVCQVRLFFMDYAERITGVRNAKLRKKVAVENMKRMLSVYYSFNDFAGAKNYLKGNRKKLSFLSFFILKLKVIKESYIAGWKNVYR